MTRTILVLLFLLCLPAGGQNAPTPTTEQPAVSGRQTTAYTLPPDKLRQSEALYKLDQKFLIFGTLYSWLVLVVVLYSGLGARYRDWAESVSCWRYIQAAIFVPLLFLTLALAELPLRIYGHHIGLQYGLSVQGWGSWLADYGKGELLSIALFAIVLWIMQTVIRWSPGRWWFYSWLASLPIIIFLIYIAPLVIDPLFNKFEPLENTNPKLVEAIEKVAQRAGAMIPRNRIYEMKASSKVTTLNAYVTGFGATGRVVIWDTTIQKTTLPETLFVVGHEMGHYVLHHILKGLVATAVGLLIGLYILFHLSRWALRRFGPRWRIRALQDWAAFPMILLLAGIMGFFAEPLGNAVSRHLEHQADVYGLEVTHGINPNSQEDAAHAFQVLGELSLDYPYPNRLEVLWYWDHPPISDRVRFAHEYDPWAKVRVRGM
ncbi:MAG TPA: M48 family metallopeptidase [Candidatus Angelobacter sp.]|nr:M48 family metallopeptidase [Candidatus Angelobacter sp.]